MGKYAQEMYIAEIFKSMLLHCWWDIDSLVALCKAKLNDDPFSGTVFAFTNRKRTEIKVLVFDGNGFWLIMKRFSKGKLS